MVSRDSADLRGQIRRRTAVYAAALGAALGLSVAGVGWWPLVLAPLPLLALVGWSDGDAGLPGPSWPEVARSPDRTLAALLEPLGSDGYRVLHGVDTGDGFADHLVVGPTGIFVIGVDGGSSRRSGDDALDAVARAAAAVFRRVRTVGVEAWVEAVVASASAPPGGSSPLRHVSILPPAALPDFIRRRPRYVPPLEVARALAAIVGHPSAASRRAGAPPAA